MGYFSELDSQRREELPQNKQSVHEEGGTSGAMTRDETIRAAMDRVRTETERLTRRSMKEFVAEYLQTRCLEDAALARMTLQAGKSMAGCFQYINGKAWDYAQEERKANAVRSDQGEQVYGCDVPDELCYQWAEEYFRAAELPEKPKKASPVPNQDRESKTGKPAKPAEHPEDEGQMSLLELGLPMAG